MNLHNSNHFTSKGISVVSNRMEYFITGSGVFACILNTKLCNQIFISPQESENQTENKGKRLNYQHWSSEKSHKTTKVERHNGKKNWVLRSWGVTRSYAIIRHFFIRPRKREREEERQKKRTKRLNTYIHTK